MIIVAGSKLVRDSRYVNDLDVVYLTFNPGKYIVLVKNRSTIGKMLSERLGVKVTFSPYIPTHTAIGNVFLAITLSRYPAKTNLKRLLLRLAYARRDVRWLLIHSMFAILGLLTAKNRRDCVKCCSMLAENMLYALNIVVPNSWRKTIELGYAISKRRNLNNLASLFHWCLDRDHVEESVAKTTLIMSALEEYVRKFIKLNDKEFSKLIESPSDSLRRIHTEALKRVCREGLAWIECSRLLLLTLYSWAMRRTLRAREFVEKILNIFAKCKNEIPVLSPLAHP